MKLCGGGGAAADMFKPSLVTELWGRKGALPNRGLACCCCCWDGTL